MHCIPTHTGVHTNSVYQQCILTVHTNKHSEECMQSKSDKWPSQNEPLVGNQTCIHRATASYCNMRTPLWWFIWFFDLIVTVSPWFVCDCVSFVCLWLSVWFDWTRRAPLSGLFDWTSTSRCFIWFFYFIWLWLIWLDQQVFYLIEQPVFGDNLLSIPNMHSRITDSKKGSVFSTKNIWLRFNGEEIWNFGTQPVSTCVLWLTSLSYRPKDYYHKNLSHFKRIYLDLDWKDTDVVATSF